MNYLPQLSGSPPPALGPAIRQNLGPSELKTNGSDILVAGTSLGGAVAQCSRPECGAGQDGLWPLLTPFVWSWRGDGVCFC